MGRSPFHSILLLSAFLLLFFSHGLGTKLKQTNFQTEEKATAAADMQFEVVSREMIELDYVEAGPNTNTRSGFVSPPPEGS
ncbi:uncharacterized protein LOC124916504 [Impatiens glandulifera]|uniref:uncharacterized protein LOC124916504 n=1 Tax=Impatiens glandulifera TaxID=253017 RepID=UPI001FB12D3A|nr:uncharacterized protein LOC124916504 [Impatiens glandulifera]